MEPEISSEAPAEVRRRILLTQKSTIASRKQQAVCVRRACKNYGPKKNPNVILDGLNMTVPKGSMLVFKLLFNHWMIFYQMNIKNS